MVNGPKEKAQVAERQTCICITMLSLIITVTTAVVQADLAAMCVDVAPQKQQVTVRKYLKVRTACQTLTFKPFFRRNSQMELNRTLTQESKFPLMTQQTEQFNL
jgi:hypothetical protein